MAYQRWWKTVRDQQGNAINGASCTVYEVGTAVTATIYDPNSDDVTPSPVANPFTTTANGVFGFMAADGEYDVVIAGGALATQQYRVTLNSANLSIYADLASTASGKGAALVGDTLDATGAVGTDQHQINSEMVSVFRFMTPAQIADVKAGTLTQDVTSAIRAAFAHSSSVFFPRGDYSVTLGTSGPSLVVLTGRSNIVVRGDGARLMDQTVYLNNDPMIAMFELSACHGFDCRGVDYVGTALASPATDLGYIGATFVNARTGSTNIQVDATLTNMRYGVLSGNYTDTTKGNCSHFKLNLVTDFVGYPIAIYLAEDVDADIYATNIHRAAYLAGVKGGRVSARWKNQYVANIAVLATDALVSAGVSRGCSGMKLYSYDLGSTVFQASSTACGIGMQRCDPGTTFEDLEFNFSVESTDSISTKVAGFQVTSGAQANGYPFNWEPTIYLNNITVSGIINRQGQTLDSNSAGDVYVITHQSGHMATIRNLTFRDVTIIPSSGTTRNSYIETPGSQNPVLFERWTNPTGGLQIYGGATYPMTFLNSQVGTVVNSGATFVQMSNSSVAAMPDSFTGAPTTGSELAGGYGKLRMKQAVLSLSGASVNWTTAIPASSIVLGVTGRILTDITGSTGFQVGPTAAPTRFANKNLLAAGSTFNTQDMDPAVTSPQYYVGSSNIVVTAKTANFTGGSIRLQMWYMDFGPPTS